MTELFIENKHLKILTSIFDKYCPKAKILAYGSRIKNTAHQGSDLDLAIVSDYEITLDKIKTAINESNIPFLVDIQILKTLPQSFQEEIKKENILIYGNDNTK